MSNNVDGNSGIENIVVLLTREDLRIWTDIVEKGSRRRECIVR